MPAGFHDPSEDIYTSDDKHQRAMDDHQKPRRQEVENELKRQDRDKLKRKKYAILVIFLISFMFYLD